MSKRLVSLLIGLSLLLNNTSCVNAATFKFGNVSGGGTVLTAQYSHMKTGRLYTYYQRRWGCHACGASGYQESGMDATVYQTCTYDELTHDTDLNYSDTEYICAEHMYSGQGYHFSNCPTEGPGYFVDSYVQWFDDGYVIDSTEEEEMGYTIEDGSYTEWWAPKRSRYEAEAEPLEMKW